MFTLAFRRHAASSVALTLLNTAVAECISTRQQDSFTARPKADPSDLVAAASVNAPDGAAKRSEKFLAQPKAKPGGEKLHAGPPCSTKP